MKRATQGFTLIESLVALVILGVVITTILSAEIANTALNSRSEQSTQAAVAAQRTMDGIRATDPAALPQSGSSSPSNVTVSGNTYQVTLTYCSPATYCTANARFIQADVTFNGKNVFSVQNVLTSVGSGIVSAGVNP